MRPYSKNGDDAESANEAAVTDLEKAVLKKEEAVETAAEEGAEEAVAEEDEKETVAAPPPPPPPELPADILADLHNIQVEATLAYIRNEGITLRTKLHKKQDKVANLECELDILRKTANYLIHRLKIALATVAAVPAVEGLDKNNK